MQLLVPTIFFAISFHFQIIVKYRKLFLLSKVTEVIFNSVFELVTDRVPETWNSVVGSAMGKWV